MSVLATHPSLSRSPTKSSQPSITLLEGLGVVGDIHLSETTRDEWRKKTHPNDSNLCQVHLIQAELFDEPGFHGDDGKRVYPGQLGENVTTVGVDLLGLSVGTKLRCYNEEGRAVLTFGDTGVGMFLEFWIRVMLWTAIISALVFEAGGIWVTVAVHLLIMVLPIVTIDTRVKGEDTAVVTITGLKSACEKFEAFRPGLKENWLVKEGNEIVGRRTGVLGVVTVGGVIRPGMRFIVERPEVFEEMKALP